jgi:hypothetical protein
MEIKFTWIQIELNWVKYSISIQPYLNSIQFELNPNPTSFSNTECKIKLNCIDLNSNLVKLINPGYRRDYKTSLKILLNIKRWDLTNVSMFGSCS